MRSPCSVAVLVITLLLALQPDIVCAAGQATQVPRQLSEADQARLRERMAANKVRMAEAQKQAELQRQEDERRRAEEERLADLEWEAQAEWEAAQPQQQTSGGFAEALLHGLGTLQDEMAKHEVERAQQEAFLDDVRRQAESVARQRERELERERQRVAEERRQREQVMAQQRQALATRNPAPTAPPSSPGSQGSAQASAPAANPAQAREQALREQAAAERQRLQAQRAAEQKAAADREQKAEIDRLARERADAERKRQEEQSRIAREQQLRQAEQALRSGFRGRAATCIGGGKDIYYLQTSTPSKTGCRVSFEARCPGTPAGAGIRFSQANYVGGSCQGLGDNIRIGQMSCAAEQVQVSMTGAECG